jgi:hypothetical protein
MIKDRQVSALRGVDGTGGLKEAEEGEENGHWVNG